MLHGREINFRYQFRDEEDEKKKTTISVASIRCGSSLIHCESLDF